MPERMPTSHPAPPSTGDAAGALDASVSAMLGQLARSDADADLAEFEALTPEAALPDRAHEIHAPESSIIRAAGDASKPRIVIHHADDDDLLRTVQELLSDALAQDYFPAGEDPSRIAAAQASESALPDEVAAARIESLDQELAGIADDLIETELAGDPEELEDDPTLSSIQTPAAAAPPEPSPTATTGPAKQDSASAAEAHREPPAASPADALDTAAPAAAPAAEFAAPAAAPILPTARPPRTVQIHLPALPGLDVLLRLLLTACAAISAPLRSKPQHIRDIVGWNALWLAFLGGCVWVYILFFRSPEPPAPSLMPENKTHIEPVSTKSKEIKSKDSGSHGKAAPDKKAPAKKSGGH